jgi:hypothetical protein
VPVLAASTEIECLGTARFLKCTFLFWVANIERIKRKYGKILTAYLQYCIHTIKTGEVRKDLRAITHYATVSRVASVSGILNAHN